MSLAVAAASSEVVGNHVERQDLAASLVTGGLVEPAFGHHDHARHAKTAEHA